MKKIYSWEPWFFIFFGLFHMHRIWVLLDRDSYASFWLGILENKGILYFLIMGILAGLCILGMIIFVRERKSNYVWQWIYFFGGVYLLFDLFAIAAGLPFWQKLLVSMFDAVSPYWNIVWGFFILLGAGVFVLGIISLTAREKYNQEIYEERIGTE